MKILLPSIVNKKSSLLLVSFVVGFLGFLLYKAVKEDNKKVLLQIQTKPAVTNISLDENEISKSPLVAKVTPGEHKITTSLTDYFTTVKNIQIPFTNEKIFVDIEANKAPQLITNISSRTSTYQNYLQIGTSNYVVFIDPLNKLVLAGTEENYFTMFADTIKYARNIDWIDNYRAVISTGAKLEEIKDYLVDFSPWLQNQVPTLTPLNIKGYLYTLSPDGKKLAYMTTTNFDDVTASIGTIDLETKSTTLIRDFSFKAPKNLIWLDENTFLLSEQRANETNYIADISEQQSLTKIYKDNITWKKDTLVYSLSSNVSINPEKTFMAYAEDGLIKIIGLTTSSNKQITVPSPIGLSLLMYKDHIVLYTHPKESNTINLGFIDIKNNTQGETVISQDILGKPTAIKSEGESLIGITTDRERYYIFDMGKYSFTMQN